MKTSLFKNEYGVWYVNIYDDSHAPPLRMKRSLQTKEKDVAEDRYSKFKDTVLPGLVINNRPAKNSRESLRAMASWYLNDYLPDRRKPATIGKYRTIIEHFIDWCRGNHIGTIQQVSFAKLMEWEKDYCKGRELASRTRKRLYEAIRAWFNALERVGLVKELPFRGWDMPKAKTEREIIPLTPDEIVEVLSILQSVAPAIWNLTRMLAFTGWRISDAIDLRWDEVYLTEPTPIGESIYSHGVIDRKQIKTSDDLCYPITKPLAEVIRFERDRHPDPRGRSHVFLTKANKPFKQASYYSQLTRTLQKQNYPKHVNPHLFRTSFVTNGVARNIPVKVMQNLCGHAKVETTLEFYAKVDVKSLFPAAHSLHESVSHQCPTSKDRL